MSADKKKSNDEAKPTSTQSTQESNPLPDIPESAQLTSMKRVDYGPPPPIRESWAEQDKSSEKAKPPKRKPPKSDD